MELHSSSILNELGGFCPASFERLLALYVLSEKQVSTVMSNWEFLFLTREENGYIDNRDSQGFSLLMFYC